MQEKQIDVRLIRVLRRKSTDSLNNGFVSFNELSAFLSLHVSLVHKRIEILEEEGFIFETHPELGVKLISSPTDLNLTDIVSHFPSKVHRVIGRELQIFDQLPSTNDLAIQHGHHGTKEGYLVFAETQTKGRGRQGREWASSYKMGLWLSILLRPHRPFNDWGQLALLAALAVAETWDAVVASLSSGSTKAAQIKWPNDVMVEDKKVAGILIEAFPSNQFVVIGIGFNINQQKEDFPESIQSKASSLMALTHASFRLNRNDIAVALIQNFDRLYTHWEILQADVVAACAQRNYLKNRQVKVRFTVPHDPKEKPLEGMVEGLNAEGHLLLRTKDGQLRTIASGEVSL